jgi:hypothetical protein
MKKKLCAILLALCLPLTLLTGCGGNGAADGFLDTLKEAKNRKDYQLELISAEDETWETGKKLTGTVSRSNSQADLTLTAFGKGDKTLGTVKILVDGKDIYLKLDEWITYLNQQFKDMTTDSEDYTDDIQTLQEVAQKLDGKYVKLSVSEDAFTLWEKSEGASGAFSKWYNGLGKALKNSVTEKDGLYTLSLDAKGLETVKVDWLTQLTENQEAYCDLLSLLLASVEDTLSMAGWSSKDYLDNIWAEYQDSLTALKENGIEKEAALEMTAEKGQDGVYTLSAVEQGETQRYLKATVTPLKEAPEQWTAPKDWKKESDLAEQLADLYLSNQTVSAANNTTQTEEEIPAEFDWDKRYQEEGDDTRDYGTDLKLSELKGYTHLKAMDMATEDNKKATLPMVPGAEYAEADKGEDDLPYSVYQSASGWEGNVYDIELAGRKLTEILKESVDTCVDIYQNEWEYKILQKATQVTSNEKGTACVAGFAYQDPERNCQVTWISVVTQVKGSQYAVAYEYSIYADNASGEVAGAMEELCQYFQLKLPLTVKTA